MLITDDIYNDLSKRIMAGEFLSPEKTQRSCLHTQQGLMMTCFLPVRNWRRKRILRSARLEMPKGKRLLLK